MRYLAALLVCSLFFTTSAFAGGAKTIEGRIVKLPDKTIVVETTYPNGTSAHFIIYLNKDTTITIDDKPAGHNDLWQRMHVIVTMKTSNIAASIAADSGRKKED